jgi:hypothetical protein
MNQPLWRANRRTSALDRREGPVLSNPLHAQCVIEAICSDAMLDGFSDMTVAGIASKTGMRDDLIERIIGELIAGGLVYVRYSTDRMRRIFEPARGLRAVYRLGD